MRRLLIAIFALSALTTPLFGLFEPIEGAPASYQGRFRDTSAYAQVWWHDLTNTSRIRSQDVPQVHASNPQELLWRIHFLGHMQWADAPLFKIESVPLKQMLGLNSSRASFNEIQAALGSRDAAETAEPLREELGRLRATLSKFRSLRGPDMPLEKSLEAAVANWQREGRTPKDIALLAEQQHPLRQRLQQAGTTLIMLPGQGIKGEWYSLAALKARAYDPALGALAPAKNFTAYSDPVFEKVRSAYMSLDNALAENDKASGDAAYAALAAGLREGYNALAGKTIVSGNNHTLTYPTLGQLRAESIYYRAPLIEGCLGLYGVALCLLLINISLKSKPLEIGAIVAYLAAFATHTVIIAMRCYILGRPPVSNMFETVIYVPWVAALAGIALRPILSSPLPLIGGAVAALSLLVVLKLSDLSGSMENVQAVLDSQYWLIIHVMMIVGSYGIFILSGILAHAYLVGKLFAKNDAPWLKYAAAAILQTLYIGIFLLIPGTILGGVWAAQSWGRFWDWDPKESWAFISGCVYLVVVHAARFGYIGPTGTAAGAIVGLTAISFTWYGVNYLLGTGLHSYGFGTGGNSYYYAYLLAEYAFLAIVGALLHQRPKSGPAAVPE